MGDTKRYKALVESDFGALGSEPIVGKASLSEGTLPGSVYFIVKYQNDP